MSMIFGILARLSRVRITLGYVAALVAVSVALVVLGPRVHDQVVGLASTNLHNLAHGHLGTLFGSAFVTDAGPIWFWLPCLVCLLALAELIWRSGRLALVFVDRPCRCDAAGRRRSHRGDRIRLVAAVDLAGQ